MPVLQPLGFLKENCAEFGGPIVVVVAESGLGNMFLASREMLTLAAFWPFLLLVPSAKWHLETQNYVISIAKCNDSSPDSV